MNKRLKRWAERKMKSRPPDFIIGIGNPPYLRRWWILPRNRFFNIYLHEILRDDDDRALHDHPWWNISYLISGGYLEIIEQPDGTQAGRVVGEGFLGLYSRWRFRKATTAHRLVLNGKERRAVSLFITGPVLREWGFHCPQGWRHWKEFTAPGNKGQVGRGCD